MKCFIAFLMMGVFFVGNFSSLHSEESFISKQKPTFNSFFLNDINTDFYWEALVQVGKSNKELALKIIEALKSGKSLSFINLTKDNYLSDINTFFDFLFLKFVSNSPQRLSYLGLFESIGIREHNAYLDDISIGSIVRDFQEKKACLRILKSFSFNDLSDDQKISYKIFLWKLNNILSGEKFLFHDYKINQMFGILSDLNDLFTGFHRLEIEEDVKNYISRLKRIPEQLSQTIKLLEYQNSQGIFMPAFSLKKVIEIIKKVIPELVTENIFYSHLASKINDIQGIDKDAFLIQAKEVIQVHVYSVYKMLQEYLIELLNKTGGNYGVWVLPNGDDYYQYLLEQHTTTTLSAEQIHELGLIEVEKIQKEMREIFAAEDIVDPDKSVGQLMQELSKDNSFFYPETDEGRDQCLIDFEKILERSRKELNPLFDLKPKYSVIIKAVPKHNEAVMPGAYYQRPSIDGKRPGTFFVNLRSMFEVPKYEMETLTVHEAEPGHHFQISLQQDMDIPILRKLGKYTVYSEGWALYVEKLAYEQGFYSSNFSKLGHLQDELLRAVRLVIDTGIHNKKWHRKKAIAYMEKITGFCRDNVITEIERYFVYPGQACSYKIGQLKFLELRQRAKNKLGERFNIQKFHNVILKTGACPLVVLEEAIDKYIKKELKN